MEYLDQVLARVFLDVRGEPRAYRRGYPARSRYRRTGWLARSGSRMLARLGTALVAVGHRLEQFGQTQQRPDLTTG